MLRALFVGVVLAGVGVADVARAGGGNDQGGSTSPFCQPVLGSYCATINVVGCAPLPKPPPICECDVEYPPECCYDVVLAPVEGGNFFELALENALNVAKETLRCVEPGLTFDGGTCSITGYEVIRQGAFLSYGPRELSTLSSFYCKAPYYRVDLRVWYLKPNTQNQ